MSTGRPTSADRATGNNGPENARARATVHGPAGPAASASMTAVLVRLKLSLLRNGLHQSSTRTVVYVVTLTVTLLFGMAQMAGLMVLRGHEYAPALVTTVTSVVALGWAAMPLFFPSGDETLDPTRLVMLPLRPRPLVAALLIASLIGVGPLFTLMMATGSVVAVAHGGAGVAAGIVAVPLVVLVCVALARAVAAGNIRLLTSRRGRDLALLSGLFIAVGTQFVNIGVQRLVSPGGLEVLEPATEVLRWIPPASAVDAVWTAGQGGYSRACAQLLLTAAALALLLGWWARSLTLLMTSPDGSTLQAAGNEEAKEGRSAGLAGLLPAGRAGTVMLRTLRYAWRDPKAKAAWATSMGIGLLLPIVTGVQGNGSVYSACWAAGLLGMQMYNQFGQDTSAFWMVAQTISSPHDAYQELRGRAMALSTVALPYVTLVVLATAAFTRQWTAVPEVLGLSLGLLGALLATGAMASARFPYSVPQDSGYKNVAPGQAGLAGISLVGGMVVGALLCSPLLALTIWLHLMGVSGLLWLLVPVGAGYGLVVAVLGLRLAAPLAAARLPEILTAVSKG
jgi:ABC-2 type transport system permease protein